MSGNKNPFPKAKDMEAETLQIFKEKVKPFQFKDCPCKISKDYIQDVGFY